jgi:hypothetical protein
MHAMTEIDWLAGFGRLMLAVQEARRHRVVSFRYRIFAFSKPKKGGKAGFNLVSAANCFGKSPRRYRGKAPWAPFEERSPRTRPTAPDVPRCGGRRILSTRMFHGKRFCPQMTWCLCRRLHQTVCTAVCADVCTKPSARRACGRLQFRQSRRSEFQAARRRFVRPSCIFSGFSASRRRQR